VFDSRTGHAQAIISDEHYLSDIRTAAAGALVSRLLAPEIVRVVTVLGTGAQARLQVLALHHERPFERLLIWGRNTAKAADLCARLGAELPEVICEVADDIESAVHAAEVVITATLAREPIVRGAWLKPGQLITAVGADDPTKCELDADALLRARLIVDSRETAGANGDVYRAVQMGHSLDDLIAAEIGDVIAGKAKGRQSSEDIVIAKLVGIGALDVAAANVALARLRERR
jgi:ornithine cyclodeaminase